MEKYTINNGFIYYGTERVYTLSKYQNADNIRECAENVHRFLLDNTDISMLGGNSIFDWLVLSCAKDDFYYVMDAFNELNHDLLVEPDDEPYFIIDDDIQPSEFFGNVLHYGKAIRIIEPLSIKENMKEEIEKMMEAYT